MDIKVREILVRWNLVISRRKVMGKMRVKIIEGYRLINRDIILLEEVRRRLRLSCLIRRKRLIIMVRRSSYFFLRLRGVSRILGFLGNEGIVRN